MSSVVNVILPIFGLILVGYVCRRTERLGETAASELNRFVVWLCLPALLFRATATATWAEVWHPEFIAVVAIGTLAIFALTLVYRRRATRHLVDASIDALGAAYANTGYVGIPLSLLVLGDPGLEPALIATLFVACVLFGLAVVCIEVGLQSERSAARAGLKVGRALARNPLVVSPILGALWAIGGLSLPHAADTFLRLLGDATTPAALVSLGLFLARRQPGTAQGTLGLVGLKLVAHPLITWVLAYHVFALPPLWAQSALLMSALPTGTGPFMLAEFYQREAAVVSRTILLTTLGSLLTLSLCLYLLQG
ncbi:MULTISPECIES: AEC family transporter [Modicisalibacter]|uniref:AEC family transporter n=1 Tax=Modicisalibacter tunisiensis TaxID=390637 RepID=A0ABS7WWN9_9GAMM|nr:MULTISPECIES: AEC family transporter [Modicisalibacter]KXS37510.1 MAG: auxin efflux carrier [Halomonadaceae bacterium T82-2]MBZ9539561.1 AEC family transporter [Modicisalibacter tunisiensis]MBZ9567034.1 AEC family transporter [Modicisalibacter tunisiensis]